MLSVGDKLKYQPGRKVYVIREVRDAGSGDLSVFCCKLGWCVFKNGEPDPALHILLRWYGPLTLQRTLEEEAEWEAELLAAQKKRASQLINKDDVVFLKADETTPLKVLSATKRWVHFRRPSGEQDFATPSELLLATDEGTTDDLR